MAKAGQILDVFSIEEIKKIFSVLSKLPDVENLGEFKAGYTNGFQPGDLVYPFIKKTVLERLEKVLGISINLTHGMLLKESKPWPIHTDYDKGDNHPSIAIVIPLNTEELLTHTVVFNQESTDGNYFLTNKKLENNASDLYNNLCSHEPVDKLEKLSLLGAYKWIPGSVIYWDRKLLHCSDNFLANDVKIKYGLVLFTHD